MLPPASDPVVTLDHVRKSFGAVVAVDDAHFSIDGGEFFSLLGPSGCGKTTLLKMIAGFEQPTGGRILLEGVDVSTVPPWRRHVNTVFQHYALFPHMSVADNVAFGPRSRKLPRAEVDKRVAEMLEVVRLGELALRRPAQLSGGQQQRVALARALVNMPSALLLDEPLAALDLKLREAMQLELKRVQREIGITFLFVTHDQGEALSMSDRIAVMSAGRVEQIGTPEEVYQRPATLFVAGFIGTANLLPGTIVFREGTEAVVQLNAGPRVRATADRTLAANEDRCTVILRPEHLRTQHDPPSDGQGLRATITGATFQGASTRLQLALADGTTLVSHVASPIEPGRSCWLAWEHDAASVLSGWSGHAGATSLDVDQVEASL